MSQIRYDVNIILAEIDIIDLKNEIKLLDDNIKNEVVIMLKGQKINTPHKFKNVGKYSLN